jgi:predicted AAA+ superfamily ATPase
MEKTLERRVSTLAFSRSREEPVILLEGPRSSGKSTLIRALASMFHSQVLDFDNQILREEVERDPSRYAEGDSMVLIDEYQRVPSILDAIKTRMNESSRPGQFILTGSTRHDALGGNIQALTGRIHRMKIYPFAQSEIEGTAPDTILKILEDPGAAINKLKKKPSKETRETCVRRIVRGGFPLAVKRGDQARNRWFDDYIRQTLERDITRITRIRNKRGLSALLRLLAAQTAQILSLERVSAAAGINISTARDYIQLLQSVFMISELPAWGRTLSARVAIKPKIHILDSGIAARLLGLGTEKLDSKDPSALTEFGHLLESFAVSEIQRELSWLDDTLLTGHWRTREGKEVDLVIEKYDGSVYGFEVKTGSRVPGDVFQGLGELRKFAGDSFKAGFVLYTGASAFQHEDRLYALPLGALWE